MFQFQFELESDLLTVLEKQPYHYARWMVILQRWEPTISPNFPSMIPFWIKIQGVPIHLWSEAVARQIVEDLGTYEVADITPQAMRMRVHVNGRLPLIKSSVLEFHNGDEVTATLAYENLERHCLKCGRLDHEIRDCLEAKHEKKTQLAAQEESLRSKASITKMDRANKGDDYPSGGPIRRSPRKEIRPSPYSRNDYQQRSSYGRDPPNYLSNSAQNHHKENYRRAESSRDDGDHFRRTRYDYKSRRSPPPRRERTTFSGDSHSASSPKLDLNRGGSDRSAHHEYRSSQFEIIIFLGGIPGNIDKALH